MVQNIEIVKKNCNNVEWETFIQFFLWENIEKCNKKEQYVLLLERFKF